jgi:hypothetical protein
MAQATGTVLATAQTYIAKAVALLIHEHAHPRPIGGGDTTAWLTSYDAARFLESALWELEELIRIVDPERLDDLAERAHVLHTALRRRRIRLKLEQTDGRTEEEAEAFRRKAEELRA